MPPLQLFNSAKAQSASECEQPTPQLTACCLSFSFLTVSAILNPALTISPRMKAFSPDAKFNQAARITFKCAPLMTSWKLLTQLNATNPPTCKPLLSTHPFTD